MRPTMPERRSSLPVRTLDHVRPEPAKAGLASDRVGPTLGAVAWRAIEAHYGSVKAAAISLTDAEARARGQFVDPSLLRREILDGKFSRFDQQADEDAKSAVADALRDAFPSNDPKAKVRRAVLRARQALDDIAEAL
jgi:hypothetical protein